MTLWLALAMAAQFLFACAVLIDRHIVVRAAHIGKPIVYAFYVSLLSGFVLVLVPFGVISFPSTILLGLSFVTAITFFCSIYFLYSALILAHASDVAPVVGAVSAIVTVVLALFWIEDDITLVLLAPVALLIIGTALISRFHFTPLALRYTVASGVAAGVTIFLTKLVFLETSFLDGFFWTRMMNVVVALGLLWVPMWRSAIQSGGKHSTHSAKFLVVGNKILAGSAAILAAYAVSIGPVSVVNALSGLQFVFLFILTFLFARLTHGPKMHTSHAHVGLTHTAVGVAFIVLGLAILSSVHS